MVDLVNKPINKTKLDKIIKKYFYEKTDNKKTNKTK